jgi:hypothetical protein
LEKAFDTVRHELLFELLRTYRIPEDVINVIQRVYRNVMLELNSGSPKDMILYSVGVKQGDAMLPVLFIVLMQAMAETLEEEWEAADVKSIDLCYFKDSPKHRGCMHGQAWNTKGTPFKIDHILYVNHSMFVFNKKN